MDKRILEMCRDIDAAKLATAQEGVTAWAEKLLEDAERDRWLRDDKRGRAIATASLWAKHPYTDDERAKGVDAAIDAEMEKNL